MIHVGILIIIVVVLIILIIPLTHGCQLCYTKRNNDVAADAVTLPQMLLSYEGWDNEAYHP